MKISEIIYGRWLPICHNLPLICHNLMCRTLSWYDVISRLLPSEGSSEAGSLCQLMLRSVYIILVTICFDYYMAVVDVILLSLVSRIANSIHIADVVG